MYRLVTISFVAAMILAAVKLLLTTMGGWTDIFIAILLILGAFFFTICAIMWEIGLRIAKRKKTEEEAKP